uniref:ceramide glucosyltransferase n=2 Tax=Meloidogyne enterolobii TaxID=390850 RepID=A0A6V7TXV5_MELEN|nr:unnamed protein product [Meloidogyne enterolobii]
MSQEAFGNVEDYQSSSSVVVISPEPGPSGEASPNLEVDTPLTDTQFIANGAITPPNRLSFGFGTEQLAIQRIFACCGILFIMGCYLLHIVSIVYGRRRLHKTCLSINREEEEDASHETKQKQQQNKLNKINLSSQLPGVSILKPLFELLFCLYSRQDPAYDLAQRLCAKYPKVDTRIFIGGQRVGLNPKINNMFPGYVASKYSHLLISDQGIYMRQNALTDMVLCMLERTDIALVTQTPFCKDRNGIWAALEQVVFTKTCF